MTPEEAAQRTRVANAAWAVVEAKRVARSAELRRKRCQDAHRTATHDLERSWERVREAEAALAEVLTVEAEG